MNVAVIRPHRMLQDRMQQALHVAAACKLYAEDHGGTYPKDLSELVPQYLNNASSLTFRSRDGQRTLKCAYLGAGKRMASDAVLLRIEAEESGGPEVIVQGGLNGVIQKAPEDQ